ncbi:LysR family transcriptional regulator [Denitromonas ohlonensis]|uniref:LysR family transcriptional regulator n=2 Tax=Denitromonas TaxID=139331 RepID=A0A557SGC9_9RHOO|nr:LysR family transcriptional regulator [Denitromonas ohlonensis]TVO67612.1 LysR family transcriptional regulator [Denitromonas ohlonensis]TVO76470.1 LysR family transcriptional regulator [Denitromonas ohlonensis]
MDIDWTDFRHFLEVARTGTLTAASARLGVDHTTVARRLSRLETALGATLFDRRRDGYVLTDTGQALQAHAEAMESAALGAEESAGGVGGAIAGAVRLGVPEVFGTRVLTPRLPALLNDHPELSVELLLQHRFVSLASREVDLAVTLEPPTSGRYVVSRLTAFRYVLYASPAYLARHSPINSRVDLAGHAFIDYVQDQLMSDELRYLDRLVDAPRRVFSCTGMLAQAQAAEAGLGLAMLAPYAVPTDSPLVQVLPGDIVAHSVLWLAAPADLFRLRRVRVVWDFLRALVTESPALFGEPAPD